MQAERKRRLVVRLQRHLLNPPVKALVHLGIVPGYAIIETTGRRTGRRRRAVVGVHRDRGGVWIVAEQGRHAGYVRNLDATPRVRLRLGGRWRSGRARVVDDDARARLASFGRRGHAQAVRRFGTELVSVRVELDGDAGGSPPAARSG